MNIKFIGTASGQTNPNRNHSALFFELGTIKILIDAGDGISKALINQNINHNEIDKIMISHFHSDHLAGLPSLLTQMIISKRNKPIEIYVPNKMISMLERFLQFSSLFIKNYDFEIKICEFNLNQPFHLTENFKFLARQNNHITNKYSLDIDNFEFISVSFLFSYEDINIVYTSDIGNANDLNLFNDFNINLFITEITHVLLSDIFSFIKSSNLDKVILTHINFDDEEKIKLWYEGLDINLKGKINLANDGMMLNL